MGLKSLSTDKGNTEMTTYRLARRSFLHAGSAATLFTPAISRAADRPTITHGLQSGDITPDSAIAWARVSLPSRVRVEFSTTESFQTIVGGGFTDALPESDLTMKLGLTGLPPGQEIFYRVVPQNLAEPSVLGEAAIGHFRTAPADSRSQRWQGVPQVRPPHVVATHQDQRATARETGTSPPYATEGVRPMRLRLVACRRIPRS